MVLPDGLEAKSKVKALSSHFDLPACAGVFKNRLHMLVTTAAVTVMSMVKLSRLVPGAM